MPGQGAPQPADQQAQAPPSQPLPQFESGVTTRPPSEFQTQPPQPPQEGPVGQRETATTEFGATPDGQQPRRGRAGETESNAAETPAENS
ncbi:hypothetical protein [Halosimplex amylolyticum]|uniref:hypothetical protein n=1 Tax=Halosimplex amylolyticum TaxID=3396616 RepID=UPI003F54D9AE